MQHQTVCTCNCTMSVDLGQVSRLRHRQNRRMWEGFCSYVTSFLLTHFHFLLTRCEWPDTGAAPASWRCPPRSPWGCGRWRWRGSCRGWSAVWGAGGCRQVGWVHAGWSTPWSSTWCPPAYGEHFLRKKEKDIFHYFSIILAGTFCPNNLTERAAAKDYFRRPDTVLVFFSCQECNSQLPGNSPSLPTHL